MDTTPKLDAILNAVTEATKRRNAARDDYGDRLEKVIRDVMEATRVSVLTVAGFRLAVERISADCSQWGNRTDYPSRWGKALLIDREFACGSMPDLSFFDGNNMQRQQGPSYVGHSADPDTATRIRPAPVAVLVAVGHALPDVIAPLLANRLQTLTAETTQVEAAVVPDVTL